MNPAHQHPPGQSRWSWCGCSSLRAHGWCYGWPKTLPDQFLTWPTCPEDCQMVRQKGWSRTPPDTFLPTRLAPCHSGSGPQRAPKGPEVAVQRPHGAEKGRAREREKMDGTFFWGGLCGYVYSQPRDSVATTNLSLTLENWPWHNQQCVTSHGVFDVWDNLQGTVSEWRHTGQEYQWAPGWLRPITADRKSVCGQRSYALTTEIMTSGQRDTWLRSGLAAGLFEFKQKQENSTESWCSSLVSWCLTLPLCVPGAPFCHQSAGPATHPLISPLQLHHQPHHCGTQYSLNVITCIVFHLFSSGHGDYL